jgi:hypothetical protein
MTHFKHHKTWIRIQPIIYNTGEMTFEWTIYSGERMFSGFIPSLKVSQNNYKVILVSDIKSMQGFLGFCFSPKPQSDYGNPIYPYPYSDCKFLEAHKPLPGWYIYIYVYFWKVSFTFIWLICNSNTHPTLAF